jgi:hypothetical protein
VYNIEIASILFKLLFGENLFVLFSIKLNFQEYSTYFENQSLSFTSKYFQEYFSLISQTKSIIAIFKASALEIKEFGLKYLLLVEISHNLTQVSTYLFCQ